MDPRDEIAGRIQAGERVGADLEGQHGQTVVPARQRKARAREPGKKFVLRPGDCATLSFHCRGTRQIAFGREGRRDAELDDDAGRASGHAGPDRRVDRLTEGIIHGDTLGKNQQDRQQAGGI